MYFPFSAGNDKVDLSEQMLIDCAPSYGCNGGWVVEALSYLYGNGAVSEKSYPYYAKKETCDFDKSKIAAGIDNFGIIDVENFGPGPLAESVYNNGPHATHVFVNNNFQHYHSGIFDDESCPKNYINHAVIIVGYDTNAGYWLIRNSYGENWGDEGHIKIAMGKNTCNVERQAWFALSSKQPLNDSNPTPPTHPDQTMLYIMLIILVCTLMIALYAFYRICSREIRRYQYSRLQ